MEEQERAHLLAEVESLTYRLAEAEETLQAIRSGEVDALVVAGPQGDQIFTLQGAERTYRVLVETINEGALILTLDGAIWYSNRAFSQMVGLPLEKVIGSPIHQFVSPSDRLTLESLLRESKKRTSRGEIQLTAADGTTVPAYLSLAILKEGKTETTSAVVTDLTERKVVELELQKYREHLEDLVKQRTAELEEATEELAAANEELMVTVDELGEANRGLEMEISKRAESEKSLLESEARFRITFDGAAIGMLLLNSKGRILRSNNALQTMLGYEYSELHKLSINSIVHPDEIEAMNEVHRRLKKREYDTYQAERRFVRKSGEPVWCSLTTALVSDPGINEMLTVMTIENIADRKQFEIERENARQSLEEVYRRERRIAETLQRSFLPDKGVDLPGYLIAEAYYPALDEATLGGDTYDVFKLPSGKVGVAIADVSGKGLKAARHGALVKYSLRAYARLSEDPAEVLRLLNNAVTEELGYEAFITCVFGVLDPEKRTLTYASAGHDEPLYIPSGSGTSKRLATTGIILGLQPGAPYGSKTVELSLGDVVFMYTDGVTDARGAQGRMGIDGLEELVLAGCDSSPRELVECVLTEVRRRSGDHLSDDVAMLAIQVVD